MTVRATDKTQFVKTDVAYDPQGKVICALGDTLAKVSEQAGQAIGSKGSWQLISCGSSMIQ